MTSPPNPGRILATLNAYQQTYALRAALDLDLFTYIGEGAVTASALAARAGASERGVRILCDYLVVIGLLTKAADRYALAPDVAAFVDRRSPAYLGAAVGFLAHDEVMAAFRDLEGAVRRGGAPASGTLAPDDPVWVAFARSMGPMVRAQAQRLAALITARMAPTQVLDVAAGHGLFGIELALAAPVCRVVAVDWSPVLSVAREHAEAHGVADRWEARDGSAFDVDLGSGYDVVLVPNFLHHFDPPTITGLLRRLHAAMRPGGLLAIVEFVPNDDRVSPPAAAGFALTMLGSTPAGDAYTFAELAGMCESAGFSDCAIEPLEPTPQHAVLARRPESRRRTR